MRKSNADLTTRTRPPPRSPTLAQVGEPMNNQVHHRLLWGLMTGRNLPGERLSIRTLSQTLKVGAMPIREALDRLESQQALEPAPSCASRVPVRSRQRIAGLFDIRRHLEAF